MLRHVLARVRAPLEDIIDIHLPGDDACGTREVVNVRLLMRISPSWIHTCHGLSQVTSRRQLSRHVRFGFSRHPRTVLTISPSYNVETRHILMRWEGDDDAIILVLLVLASEHLWIMQCDHDKVLRHLFCAELAFISC